MTGRGAARWPECRAYNQCHPGAAADGRRRGLELRPKARPHPVILIAETLMLALIINAWSGVLPGNLRFGAIGSARIIEALGKLLGGVALVIWGYGAVGTIGATVLFPALSLAYVVWTARSFTLWRAYRQLGRVAGVSRLDRDFRWPERADYDRTNFDLIGIDLFIGGAKAVVLAGFYQQVNMLPRMLVLLARTYASALFPYIARADEQQMPLYARAARWSSSCCWWWQPTW